MNKALNVKITSELKNPSEPGIHYRLLCMTGPNKGKVYYLTGKRVVIGRGETADIQIVDVKISREHAELSFADDGYTITDLGAQNGIIVNDKKVKQKKLADTEKIVIGQTVFKYNVIEISSSTDLSILDGDAEVAISKETSKSSKAKPQLKIATNDNFSNRKNTPQEKKGGSKFIVILLIVGIIGFVLFSGDYKPVKQATRNTIDPKDLNDGFAETNLKKTTQDNAEIKKKLENYIHSGRREFSEGNYFRAIEDFRLALLISPNDGHASFYLSKAKQSLDDDIEKNFTKGKQEHDSKKYQAAIVSYCGVVQLIQNYPDDVRYKNAMLQISAIESELGMEKGEVKCFEEKSADSKN